MNLTPEDIKKSLTAEQYPPLQADLEPLSGHARWPPRSMTACPSR
ncbi:MAG: hypothetical protein ACLT9P_01940 [Evtepia gabavorous]